MIRDLKPETNTKYILLSALYVEDFSEEQFGV